MTASFIIVLSQTQTNQPSCVLHFIPHNIMAVQAQYPSNALFFDRNNGQDGHDCSLQPQAGAGGGGGFLDQSMLFNNGGGGAGSPVNTNNHRKRGRESVSITNPISTQSPHLIDISTGLRLSFADHQHLHHQNHNNPHHHQQHQSIVCNSPAFLSLLSDDLAAQIKQQRDELDQFLQAQGEQLRRTLGEKRQRHYRALVSSAEETVARRLREKEVEAEKAARRNAELEARAAQLTVEAQVWQAKARAQEATAATLQVQLQQAIMSGAAQESMRADERFDGIEGQAEDAESAYVDPERTVMGGPPCKSCRDRVASVVLLPCRHLCICTECDQVAQACPVCLTLRNSSVEVFLT